MNLKEWFLLVCIFSLTHGLEPRIDLTRCQEPNPDSHCFVRGSCLSPTGADKLKLIKMASSTILNTCDVVVQIKPYTISKWHVMMQINRTSSGEQLNHERGIELFQKESQFSCNKSEVNVNPLKFTTDQHTFKWKNDTDLMFCSFFLSTKDVMMAASFAQGYGDKKPYIRYYSSGKLVDISYGSPGAHFWMSVNNEQCNPDVVTTNNTNKWPWILSEIETTRLSFRCETGQIIISYKEIFAAVNFIECENTLFNFVADGATNNSEIQSTETFEAYCGVRQTCSPLKILDCSDCKPPDDNTTCPHDKWQLDYDGPENGIALVTTVQCNQSTKPGAGFTGGWFATIKGEQKEISAGTCSDKFDCKKFSALKFECGDIKDCAVPTYSSDEMNINCTDGYNLKFGDNSGSTLACISDNGLYYAGGKSAARGSQVFCEKVGAASPSSQSSGMGHEKIGFAIGVILLFIVLIAILVLYLRNRRRKDKQKTTQSTTTTNNDDVKTAKRYDSKEHRTPTISDGPPSTDKESNKEEERTKRKKSKESPLSPVQATSSAEGKQAKPSKKHSREKPDEKKEPEKKEVNDIWSRKKHERNVLNRSEMANYIAHTKRNPQSGGKKVTFNTVSEVMRKAEVVPGETRLAKWNDNMFFMEILMVFHRYSRENRIKCLDSLTTFQNYSPTNPEPGFGTLKQLFQIVQYAQPHGMRCQETWERMFRVIKILHESVPKDDARDITGRMAAALKDIGANNIEKYGYAKKSDETPAEAQMRMMGVRLALWGGDDACIEVVKKLASLKPSEVDAPLRMAVFSYAINSLGKEKELKELFYEELKKNRKEHPKKDALGTMRQHLLFALCSARNRDNKEDEFATLKEIMAVVNESDKQKRLADFSLTDLLFAYRGATEDRAAWPTVLELFQKYTPPDVDEFVDPLIEELCKTPDEKRKLSEAFKQDAMELCTLLAECAATEKDSRAVMETCSPYIFYAAKPGVRSIDSGKYKERAANLQALTTHKSRADWMHEALLKCKF